MKGVQPANDNLRGKDRGFAELLDNLDAPLPRRPGYEPFLCPFEDEARGSASLMRVIHAVILRREAAALMIIVRNTPLRKLLNILRVW